MTETEAPAPTAASLGLASCHLCAKVSEVSLEHCPRCGSALHLRKPQSVQRTWALIIGAIVLYFPANLMPIMTVQGIGGNTDNTIMSGVITFWGMKAYPVAIVIFVASVLIPIFKIGALIWLCREARNRSAYSPKTLAKIYYITEILGRWSMVDVFVVAILVTLVRMGSLMTINPGPAAVSFAMVVILTMFAAMSFDPRLIWDRHREDNLGKKPSNNE